MSRDAILQFEMNREHHGRPLRYEIGQIIKACQDDVLANTGTMVLVVSNTTITVVQRATAPSLDQPGTK